MSGYPGVATAPRQRRSGARRSDRAKVNGAAKARHMIALPAWLRFVYGSRDRGVRLASLRSFRRATLRKP
jgi:hypothetical protein